MQFWLHILREKKIRELHLILLLCERLLSVLLFCHATVYESDFIPMEVMGLVIIVTLEAVEEPGLTTTTGVPELVGNPEGLGKILLPLDPGKLWVIIFMPVK